MKIKIVSWNLAWGCGAGSEGVNYQPRSREFMEKSLRDFANTLREYQADIACLQEVDFDASRSHHIDQSRFISWNSELHYRETFVSWNHPYVPYPGLNPAKHFGAIKSGGAILSRYPLKSVESVLLPKPKEFGILKNSFYLSRYIQVVDVEFPEKKIRIGNLHLEAFSEDNRAEHLKQAELKFELLKIDALMGDWNGPIQSSKRWKVTQSLPTFPSHHTKNALDGIVTRSTIKVEKFEVLPESKGSDHLGLLIELTVS